MTSRVKTGGQAINHRRKRGFLRQYWVHRGLFMLFLPAILYYVLFKYLPMYGVQIAFRDYKLRRGIMGSDWVGFAHFVSLFSMPSFWEVLRNTFIISILKFAFGFPAPILLALLLNEIRHVRYKRIIQTVSYLPHFLSWIVLSSIFLQLLSPSIGPVNQLIRMFGGKPIYFMADTRYFRSVLVVTSIWKGIGWGSIVYLAALTGINPEFYEAAYIDGASRFQCVRYITLPSMTPVITIMLIFAVGNMIDDDFNQIFNMYNTAVYSVADVLSTYTYHRGLRKMEFGFASAVDLFKNIVSLILVVTTNTVARRINEYGIW